MVAYENIMIDLETLGTRPGCTILSIGACSFGSSGIGEHFYELICPESCDQWGLKIEPRTALWWLEQNEEARNSLLQSKKLTLDDTLLKLKAHFKWKGKRVWCNGASFDFPILEAGYNAIGHDTPWEFFNQMDYRTLKNIVPRDVYDKIKVESQIKHNALTDAVAQAETANALLSWLGKK